jgi:hypothetical protein
MIAHPNAGGCRTPAQEPVLFRGLVSASCTDVTANPNVKFTWTTKPTSPLDGKTGNDQMQTLALGIYTITLTVDYMGQTATSNITFSIKDACL